MRNREKASVQDQGREDMMIAVLGLKKQRGRLGYNAEDNSGHKFELKSTTKNGFGTGRDVSVDTITKWRERYWIFARGTNYADGFEIESLYFCNPSMMQAEFDRLERRFQSDIIIRNTGCVESIRNPS